MFNSIAQNGQMEKQEGFIDQSLATPLRLHIILTPQRVKQRHYQITIKSVVYFLIKSILFIYIKEYIFIRVYNV